MPTYDATTHHGLRKLRGTNLILDVDAGFAALADDLDGIISTADIGLYSDRPAAGVNGRWYWAYNVGILYYDTGTALVPVYNRPLRGHVNADGTAAAGPGGSGIGGWLPTRTSTGVYQILFNIGFNSNFTPHVTPFTTPSPVIPIVSFFDSNGFTAELFNLAGTHVNSAFFWSAEAER